MVQGSETTLLQWLISLINSPEEKAAFEDNPRGYLDDHGWEDLTPQDMNDVLPLLIENTQGGEGSEQGLGNQQGFLNNQQDFSSNQSLDNSSNVTGGNINFGGENAAQFGSAAGNLAATGGTSPYYTGMQTAPDADPTEAVIQQLHYITNNFTADQRVTNVDNSLNQNIDNRGGLNFQNIDNDPVNAIGDGAQAAGENLTTVEGDGNLVAGDRLRHVMREAEETIEKADPAQAWEQFSQWVSQSVSAAASASFVWATERARELAVQVAEHFDSGGTAVLPRLRMGSHEDAYRRSVELEAPEEKKFGMGERALAGMRGGYMGAMMFGMIGTMALGMTLLNPLSIGAGLVLGGKQIRDERKRRLEQRRMGAKQAVRKHIDDVTFQVGKDCRDMLRELQRTLRDHFTTHAQQLQTSVTASLQAAQQSVATTESERTRRITDLDAELSRINRMANQARALEQAAVPVPVPVS